MDGSAQPPRQADWKVGVDIGGTFIDFCALEAHSGQIVTLKVLTTPDNPGAELMTGLSALAEGHGLDLAAISRFVHGTTVGINTVIQRKGARLALLTNAGFEDVMELVRLRMPDVYSLFCARPEPLVGRDMVFGIATRMRADGSSAQAPDMGTVAEAVAQARAAGAEGIIVSFLHAWRNDAHERAVRDEVARLAPDLFVFTSAEVWPVIREYERSTTAVLNGYVHPRVAGYLAALESGLAGRGVPARAMLTKSNGGLMTAGEGRRSCVQMLLSGTASGVTGAAWLARQAGESKVLTLDIGGTSADFALIIDGQPQFGTGELIGEFPLYIPSVSVSSIGIGGGSIASVGETGVLRVGPESAGSTPGPACYGRGGTEATVTDALAVCGWLGHSDMAYGQLRLDPALARAAVGRLADRLGRSPEETAQAIIDVAVSEMFVEVEKLASRAGIDLRDFTLMPFGGGGPMLAALLARELGLKRLIGPRRPGVVSALGGLVADFRGDFIRTVFAPLTADTLPELNSAWQEMAQEGRAWLVQQGHVGPVRLHLSADMRYGGQSHEIEVALDPDALAAGDPAPLLEAFHQMHARHYDFHDPDGAVELVNLRLAAIGDGPALHPQPAPTDATPPPAARQVTTHVDGVARQIPLYQRGDLRPGARLNGPCIVVQEDTTFAIPDRMSAEVDGWLNLHLAFRE